MSEDSYQELETLDERMGSFAMWLITQELLRSSQRPDVIVCEQCGKIVKFLGYNYCTQECKVVGKLSKGIQSQIDDQINLYHGTVRLIRWSLETSSQIPTKD